MSPWSASVCGVGLIWSPSGNWSSHLPSPPPCGVRNPSRLPGDLQLAKIIFWGVIYINWPITWMTCVCLHVSYFFLSFRTCFFLSFSACFFQEAIRINIDHLYYNCCDNGNAWLLAEIFKYISILLLCMTVTMRLGSSLPLSELEPNILSSSICWGVGMIIVSGFHLLGGAGGNIPPQIFYLPPPKTFIVKLNNNCLVYAFFSLSSAVLALVKHELSQKYTRKSFHAVANTLAKAFMLRQEGDPPRHGLPPQTKNPRWNPEYAVKHDLVKINHVLSLTLLEL